MPIALHKKWHLLPSGRPGERFRRRYHEHQKSKNRNLGSMLLRFLLAGAAACIGVVLMFIPGPAILFFLIAGALLASDWLPVARLLDWGEVHARRLWTRAHSRWKQLSAPLRVVLAIFGAAASAGLSYGFYLAIR